MALSSAFVRTNGTHFEIGEQPFRLVGGNNYYLACAPKPMVEAVFALAVKMELNVLRTWAFADCGVAGAGPTPPGTKDEVCFHYWNPAANAPDFNDGPNGLERLDQAIALAEQYGLRLILPFANYWPDFGGVDQYLKWFGLSRRDQFYRNRDVKKAYRDYVEHLLIRVNTRTGRRYADEPAILAWELMNEPRCVGDRGSPISDGVETLVRWIDEMSAFVKSLDGNHMVAVGDEGYFCRSGAGRDALYNGSYGVDCERILGISNIDFGTCHLYPDFALPEDAASFGVRWIREHIQAGQRADKPMLIEEYGYRTAKANSEEGKSQRDSIFQAWLDEVLESDGSGALVWMIASVTEGGRLYPDYDSYTTYQAEDVPSILSFSRAANGERSSQTRATDC